MEPEEIFITAENQCCCANCEYWEERSGFCRIDPPKPQQMTPARPGQSPYFISVFPKISMPLRDYCSKGKFKPLPEEE